jgi:hypothetical protein
MQNRAFLKVSPVENVSFFQKEMFEGSYLSSYGITITGLVLAGVYFMLNYAKQ